MARRRAPGAVVPPALPLPLPVSPADLAQEERLARDLEDLVVMLRQRALDRAVALAQQAARGHGPLVDYFIKLGTDYAKLLDAPQKPKLQVVKGGRQ